MNKKVYITTPIYYANGSPHIGHFLTTTVADSVARYYRKKLGKENVYFTTGVDEHGTKVLETSKEEGYDNPQTYVDERSKEFKKVFDKTNISYDYFVRTTNAEHKSYAQEFIKKMKKNGDVYKDTYKGKYCTGCEKFLTLSDLDEDGYCPDHRKDQVIEIEEDNYFFKLSKYADKVKDLISEDKLKVVPENKKNEILSRLEEGIDDVSISRPKSKVPWGVEFPGDSDQTVYVWVEALVNYLSSLHINKKEDLWQGTVNHLLGKEISWFHNVIWPAMLLSADEKLFEKSFVHGFLNVSGRKMSKSLGNVISPEDLLEKYGSDGSRFLALYSLPYANDSDVTWELLNQRYTAVLANGIGNLLSRITKLCENSGFVYSINLPDYDDEYEKLNENIEELMANYKLHDVCKLFSKHVSEVDKQIQNNKPWENIAESREFLERALNKVIYLTETFEFILPETFEKVADHFSVNGKLNLTSSQDQKIRHLTDLYPRI